MKKKITLLSCCIVLHFLTYAQNSPVTPLTADSLATGNYKDVLTSFFQLGLEHFTRENKELKFSSNPFAVMAKMDSSLLQSSNYYRLRNLRNLNFAVSVKLDSSYKFNGFSSTIKYALINKRDETVSWAFVSSFIGNEEIQGFFQLNNFLIQNVSRYSADREVQKAMMDEARNFIEGKTTFGKLKPELQVAIKAFVAEKKLNKIATLIENEPGFNPKKIAAETYNKLKESINNKLLWTVSLSDTTYGNQFRFSSVVLSTDLVKGIDQAKTSDIELNVNANIHYTDDSVKTGRDLKRSIFSFEPGFNFVAKTKTGMKSFLEFKVGGGYYHVLTGGYPGEEKNRVTINGTLRLRIFNDIWVPLEIKYEPKTGNVFGFLNIRANFTALKALAKK